MLEFQTNRGRVEYQVSLFITIILPLNKKMELLSVDWETPSSWTPADYICSANSLLFLSCCHDFTKDKWNFNGLFGKFWSSQLVTLKLLPVTVAPSHFVALDIPSNLLESFDMSSFKLIPPLSLCPHCHTFPFPFEWETLYQGLCRD